MNHITFRPWLLDNYIDLIYRTKKRKIKVYENIEELNQK